MSNDLLDREISPLKNQDEDFKVLLRYINHLARHKLGYPVSLLTYLGVVDNQILGIMPGTLANVLLNNVGDPFKDSETSLMEVKEHEREIILILESYYGLEKGTARGYVTTGGTEGNFAGLWWSKRYLINCLLPLLIKRDDALKLQLKDEQEENAALNKIPYNDAVNRAKQLQKILDLKNAINTNKNIVQELLTPTVFFTKGHTHYSIPKIAEILRLNIRTVEPNEDGSMNLANFKKEIILNLGAHPFSPFIIIANIGTTVTGAIDDVPGIKKILDDIQPKPTYTIHLDGALTGFVMPILKPFGDVPNYFNAIGVNTLAVSAHKYPGLSQPCGILLATKKFFDKAFEKSERSIDYVGNILDVTITGSRSGLNVLMFYNALYTLGLNQGTAKLTRMVKTNLRNAKYLYHELIKIYGEKNVRYPYHFNVTFPRPSMSLAKKYQLMITGDRATICVLTNVTPELIDQFITDLKKDEEHVMKITPTKEHTIQTLDEKHIQSTVDLFTRAFCDSEPITKHLAIQYSDYEPFARAVVEKAVKEKLSLVALDQQNRVIAYCIAEDIANPFRFQLALYPKLAPILALIDELSKNFLDNKKFIEGKVAHIWIAGVDPEWRGHKLSTEIGLAITHALMQKGYAFAYAEFTNALSEKVVNQYPLFELINRIRYDDFIFSGHKPFQGLKGAASAYVAVIQPGLKLKDLENVYRVKEEVE